MKEETVLVNFLGLLLEVEVVIFPCGPLGPRLADALIVSYGNCESAALFSTVMSNLVHILEMQGQSAEGRLTCIDLMDTNYTGMQRKEQANGPSAHRGAKTVGESRQLVTRVRCAKLRVRQGWL